MRLPHLAFCLTALALALTLAAAVAVPAAQESPGADERSKGLDQILDLYVRDGYVYYRALRADRGTLDRYLNEIAATQVDALSREAQIAFWLNAYNATVLRTVIDRYPIAQRTTDYPRGSIRQIPGAFEREPHKLGGRTVTLDQIEQTILATFRDPRLYLALGRGSVGGGRLRSEAFAEARLERQLKEVADECVTRSECVQVDRLANKVVVTPIFSWREKEFVAAYADSAPPTFSTRSPVERAALAFVNPKLLTTEREFLEKNEFQIAFKTFDWTLNDLTGRGGR